MYKKLISSQDLKVSVLINFVRHSRKNQFESFIPTHLQSYVWFPEAYNLLMINFKAIPLTLTKMKIAFWFGKNKKITIKPCFFLIGQATMVSFHVTVMSLDTIDEGSMVKDHYWILITKSYYCFHFHIPNNRIAVFFSEIIFFIFFWVCLNAKDVFSLILFSAIIAFFYANDNTIVITWHLLCVILENFDFFAFECHFVMQKIFCYYWSW